MAQAEEATGDTIDLAIPHPQPSCRANRLFARQHSTPVQLCLTRRRVRTLVARAFWPVAILLEDGQGIVSLFAMTTRFCILALSVFVAAPLCPASPRVFSEGKLPDDIRLQPQKDLDGY